jgi:hypothetical protein
MSKPAIIIGTGPSLNKQKADILRLANDGYMLFGVNNTYMDFDLDVWIATDRDSQSRQDTTSTVG